MPTRIGKDKKGRFARWGSSGKKYYFKSGSKSQKQRAINRAKKQGQAAHAHGYGNK